MGSAVAILIAGWYYDRGDPRQRLVVLASLMVGCTLCVAGAAWVLRSAPRPGEAQCGSVSTVSALVFVIAATSAPPAVFPFSRFAMVYGGQRYCATVMSFVDATGFCAAVLFFRYIANGLGSSTTEAGSGAGRMWAHWVSVVAALSVLATVSLVRFLWLVWKRPVRPFVARPSAEASAAVVAV